MRKPIDAGVFKPRPSQAETKGDVTTRVVREILDREESKRAEKTARLRAARRAKEEAEEAAPKPEKSVARRKRPASRRTSSVH